MFKVLLKRPSLGGLLLSVALIVIGVRAFRRATGEMQQRDAERDKWLHVYLTEQEAITAARRAESESVWREIEAVEQRDRQSLRHMTIHFNEISELLGIELERPETVSHGL